MKIAVFAFTARACDLALRVSNVLSKQAEEIRLFAPEKFSRADFAPYCPPFADFVAPQFAWADLLIFVGSSGMAVRAIAPSVRSKKTDPAVLVLDEAGRFVISLLSGHIGGANALTAQLAAALGATPVITTATDVNGKFAVDEWAARNGMHIGSMALAKAVAAEILERDVPLCADAPIVTSLPGGTVAAREGELGIYIGFYDKKPFDKTLQLTPKVLTLGIGCRKNTTEESIAAAVDSALSLAGIDPNAIAQAASIDLKAEETGLLDFCEHRSIPIRFYSAEELSRVEGDFTPSAFVRGVTGVDNVCERAAMAGAEKLILKKTAMDGVTVAIAEKSWEVAF